MKSKSVEKISYIILVLGILIGVIAPFLKPQVTEQGFKLIKTYNFELLFLIIVVSVLLYIVLISISSVLKNLEDIAEQNKQIIMYVGNKKSELNSFLDNRKNNNTTKNTYISNENINNINIPIKSFESANFNESISLTNQNEITSENVSVNDLYDDQKETNVDNNTNVIMDSFSETEETINDFENNSYNESTSVSNEENQNKENEEFTSEEQKKGINIGDMFFEADDDIDPNFLKL